MKRYISGRGRRGARVSKGQNLPRAQSGGSAKPPEVAISGATGLVGRRLVQKALERYNVRVLCRDEARARRQIAQRGSYAGATPRRVEFFGPGEWSRGIGGADAVVCLNGRSLITRWTDEIKSEIELSRVRAVERVASLVNGLPEQRRPFVLVSASAVGVYGDMTGTEELRGESGPIGDRESDFLVRVCCNWEQASRQAACRAVQARLGIVLSEKGGALASMAPAFQLGVGGPIGRGQQPVSWIERTDAVRMILAAIEDEAFSGPMNVCAPNPVDMNELATSLGRALLRPSWATVPAPVLRAVLGEGAKVLCEGQRAYPQKALNELNFSFEHEQVQSALDAIYPNQARDKFLRRESSAQSQ